MDYKFLYLEKKKQDQFSTNLATGLERPRQEILLYRFSDRLYFHNE